MAAGDFVVGQDEHVARGPPDGHRQFGYLHAPGVQRPAGNRKRADHCGGRPARCGERPSLDGSRGLSLGVGFGARRDFGQFLAHNRRDVGVRDNVAQCGAGRRPHHRDLVLFGELLQPGHRPCRTVGLVGLAGHCVQPPHGQQPLGRVAVSRRLEYYRGDLAGLPHAEDEITALAADERRILRGLQRARVLGDLVLQVAGEVEGSCHAAGGGRRAAQPFDDKAAEQRVAAGPPVVADCLLARARRDDLPGGPLEEVGDLPLDARRGVAGGRKAGKAGVQQEQHVLGVDAVGEPRELVHGDRAVDVAALDVRRGNAADLAFGGVEGEAMPGKVDQHAVVGGDTVAPGERVGQGAADVALGGLTVCQQDDLVWIEAERVIQHVGQTGRALDGRVERGQRAAVVVDADKQRPRLLVIGYEFPPLHATPPHDAPHCLKVELLYHDLQGE